MLLDGAQGVGAVPVDVHALGVDAYAGVRAEVAVRARRLGMLYVSAKLQERLQVSRRGYANLEDPSAGLAARLHPDARRFDCFALSAEALACALRLARRARRGRLGAGASPRRACSRSASRRASPSADARSTPRGPSTLVSFSSPDPPPSGGGLAERGVMLRDIPDRPLLRASVGAWNDEHDLHRLIEALEDGA